VCVGGGRGGKYGSPPLVVVSGALDVLSFHTLPAGHFRRSQEDDGSKFFKFGRRYGERGLWGYPYWAEGFRDGSFVL